MSKIRYLFARCFLGSQQLGILVLLLLVLSSAPLQGATKFDYYVKKCTKGADIAYEIQTYRDMYDPTKEYFIEKQVKAQKNPNDELVIEIANWLWGIDPEAILPRDNVKAGFMSMCMGGMANDGAAGI